MTLQQLRYAIAVAHCGSMNEAAKRLFITQPSLSGAIRELENELGLTLFFRTNRGIVLTPDGEDFLGYARQVVEQMNLLEERYLQNRQSKRQFSVSTQHYAFAVGAFVALIRHQGLSAYDCTLRETRTYEIIQDVHNLRSELGLLYLNTFNEKVLNKLFAENELEFHPLFVARPHVFLGAGHPLAGRTSVRMEELEEYPCLSFEQGEYNSFHFSEEILSTLSHAKTIRVSDRASVFNCLIGLNGFTISTGILTSELNGSNIVSVPLESDEHMTVGWVGHRSVSPSRMALCYLEELSAILAAEQPPQ